MVSNKKVKKLIAFAIIILLFVIICFKRSPEDKFFTVAYGEIKDGVEVQCVFVRDEIVQVSPFNGIIKTLIFEGERQTIGSPILTIENEEGIKTVFSLRSGLISFTSDGWEEILKPAYKQSFTKETFTRIKNNNLPIRDGQEIKVGQPLFRTVDNFNLYILLEVDKEDYFFQMDKRMRIKFPRLSDKYFWSSVVLLNKKEEIALLKVESFIAEFLSLRQQPVKIIKNEYSGLIVPVAALHIEKGQSGVWVVDKAGPRFQMVKILGKGNDYAVVEGLKVGDEIYRKPPKGF